MYKFQCIVLALFCAQIQNCSHRQPKPPVKQSVPSASGASRSLEPLDRALQRPSPALATLSQDSEFKQLLLALLAGDTPTDEQIKKMSSSIDKAGFAQ